MNILISCAGKQVELLRLFRRHLTAKDIIVATDSNPQAAAFAVADYALQAPPVEEQHYEAWILTQCRNYNIGLVLSLHEDDLLVLENLRNKLTELECHLVGTPVKRIRECTDKYVLFQMLKQLQISTPDTWKLETKQPVASKDSRFIIKPRQGRGSRGVLKSVTAEQVAELLNKPVNKGAFIVQPMLEGVHYCFDVVNDLRGLYRATLIRQKVKMGAEETEIAVTVDHPAIEVLAKRLSAYLKHQGSIDVEAVETSKGIFVYDVNLRFGGCYLFSHAAGADIPGALLSWAKKEEPPEEWLQQQPEVVSAKYNQVQLLDIKSVKDLI